MTTRTTPSPLEILADSGLRDAAQAGAAVVALDVELNAVLFADAAGQAILGSCETAPSPALRQVRSAARSLAETGRARLLLRQSTRTGTRTIPAELTLRPAASSCPAFALLTIAGLGRPLDDADLAKAVGLEQSAAAIYADGALRHATPRFDEPSLPDLAAHLAAFEAGEPSFATVRDGAVTLTLTRAPFGRIVVLAEVDPAPLAATPPADDVAAEAAPTEAPAGFSTFSVKRARIGDPRPGMSMGALLQRWHSRGPETPPQAAEAEPARQTASNEPAAQPDGPSTAETPSSATAGTIEALAEPSADRRVRSNWGGREAASFEPVAPVVEAEAPLSVPSVPLPIAGAASADAVPAQDKPSGADDGLDRSPVEAAGAAHDDGADSPVAVEPVASPDEPAGLPDTSPAPVSSGEDVAPAATAPSLAEERAPSDRRPATAGDGAAERAAARPAFLPRFDVAPVRFVWQIDRDGAFRFLSPDFAGAVGPNAADVVGRSFAAVARVFGFDETREIARLLERRDTWSGRTILWPVEGSDRKVPVDLAALPVYGRDRSFDGFRGFGIVRLNESVADEEGLGLFLTQGPAPARDETAEAAPDDAPQPEPAPPREKPFLRRFEAESFGRRAEPPASAAEAEAPPETGTDPTQKVIRLEERRRPREGALSTAEEAAFRAIGAKLANKAEAESPGALRFEDPAAPASAGTQALPAPTEPDGIEPALEASSETLATAEAEAASRLTAGLGPSPSTQEPAETAGSTLDVPTDDDRLPAETPVDETVDVSRRADPADRPSATEVLADDGVPVAEASVAEGAAAAVAEPASAIPAVPGLHPGDEPDEQEDDEDASPLDLAVFDRLFSGLPLALLVQVREHTVYVNAAFAALTGHADAEAVEAAGGLDALVIDRQGEGTLALLRADGEVVEVRGHMQRTAEGGRSALLMSFSRAPGEESLAGPELDDLRQEVEELQAVLDTATDGVVLLDIAGNIRAMNGSAHALFGIGADEAFGRHLSSLVAPESQKATVDYLDMLRDDGIGGILNDGREVIGRVSQGGSIPLFITIGRLSGERGWCVVIRDIAHWKRIEEDLVNARRQAEAASLHKSRFLANISHELRTPLNAIIGFADVMSSECFGPIGNERYLEYLGDIKRSGHHVLDLVNDLLDISKIEAGKIDLSFEAVPLNEVISEAVSLMQPQANRERVIVRSNLPSSVPPVVADRRSVRQIALNLLANAIRFTPAGGQIIASTTYSAEGDVLLRFRDSGIGMTEREIELALTPFQQVHAPSANRGEGTGLGLPLTKAMVEANRAYFSIQSTPGEGTLVEIVFPAPRVLAD